MPTTSEPATPAASSRRVKAALITAAIIVLLPGVIAFVLYSHHRRTTAPGNASSGERDQLALAADKNLADTGDLNKALEEFRQIVAANPNDYRSLDALGVVYARLGQYTKAADADRQALKLAPDALAPYEHLPYYSMALQQPEDAHQTIRDAMTKKMDSAAFHKVLYAIAFLAPSSPDTPAMADQVRWFAIHPADESTGLALASNTAAYGGRLALSRDFTTRAADAAVRAGDQELAAAWLENAALREAAFGNSDAARKQVADGLKLAPSSRDAKISAALTYAMIGDVTRAEVIAYDLEKQYLRDTQLQSVWLPAVRAQIALEKKNGREAVDDLAPALPLELGETGPGPTPTCMYSTYLRGEAYLASDKGSAAATEFQKIVDHPGVVWNCWTGALARMGMARAHMLEAREFQDQDSDRARAKAVVAYKEFLKLWKDADPGIPLLEQVRQELDQAQQPQE